MCQDLFHDLPPNQLDHNLHPHNLPNPQFHLHHIVVTTAYALVVLVLCSCVMCQQIFQPGHNSVFIIFLYHQLHLRLDQIRTCPTCPLVAAGWSRLTWTPRCKVPPKIKISGFNISPPPFPPVTLHHLFSKCSLSPMSNWLPQPLWRWRATNKGILEEAKLNILCQFGAF